MWPLTTFAGRATADPSTTPLAMRLRDSSLRMTALNSIKHFHAKECRYGLIDSCGFLTLPDSIPGDALHSAHARVCCFVRCDFDRGLSLLRARGRGEAGGGNGPEARSRWGLCGPRSSSSTGLSTPVLELGKTSRKPWRRWPSAGARCWRWAATKRSCGSGDAGRGCAI